MSCRFLKNMIAGGLRSLTVAGTCYEYGLASGCLAEDAAPAPTTCYAVAKNALRVFLEALKKRYPFQLTWCRLFFLYGEGQHPKALIPQVDRALAAGQESFDMSGGEQLRDYLPVEEASRILALIAMQDRHDGIVNICSGTAGVGAAVGGRAHRPMRRRHAAQSGRLALSRNTSRWPFGAMRAGSGR